MLTWMVGLCVSLFPPGWTRLEFTFWQEGLRGRHGLPVTLHRAGGMAVTAITLCFACFFSFTFIVTLYFETFLNLQKRRSISKHSCAPFTQRPHSGFPTDGTHDSSLLLLGRDPIQDHTMARRQSGSVLGSFLGICSLDVFEYSKVVFCQMPLILGLSDVSS